MTLRHFHSLLALVFIAFYSTSQAQEAKPLKYYDVEIVIFKNINTPKGQEQILPVQVPTVESPFVDLTDLDSIRNAETFGFSMPRYNELRLTEQTQKIMNSSRYKLLVHTAWRQPGLARDKAIPIKIQAGQTFDNGYSSIDPAVQIKPEFSLIMQPENETTMPVEQKLDFKQDTVNYSTETQEEPIDLVWYELEGNITISLARYLHAYVNLVLRIPNENTTFTEQLTVKNTINTQQENNSEFNFTSQTLNNFALKERRRMRSKRLHYLDNPEFGMLILITPYEIPKNSIEDTTSN